MDTSIMKPVMRIVFLEEETQILQKALLPGMHGIMQLR